MRYSVLHRKSATVSLGSIARSVPLVVSQVSWVQVPLSHRSLMNVHAAECQDLLFA